VLQSRARRCAGHQWRHSVVDEQLAAELRSVLGHAPLVNRRSSAASRSRGKAVVRSVRKSWGRPSRPTHLR
jgi:hypothetical protein